MGRKSSSRPAVDPDGRKVGRLEAGSCESREPDSPALTGCLVLWVDPPSFDMLNLGKPGGLPVDQQSMDGFLFDRIAWMFS